MRLFSKASSAPARTNTVDQSPIRTDVLRLLHTISLLSALVVTTIGTVVLIGWITKNELLKSVIYTLPSMKANTAIAFVAAGIALGISQFRKQTTVWLVLRYISAVIVILIGFLTFSQYITGLNLGIDQLFFTEPPGALGTASPNRMAPNSAMLFLLTGLALILLNIQVFNRYVYHIFTVIGAIVFLPTLIGYIYGIDFIYGVATTTKMAIHTAVAFFFLLIGIFTARPLYGFTAILVKDDAGGFLARRLAVTSIFIPFILGWIILEGFLLHLYDVNFRFLLLIGMCVTVFTFLIWRNAVALSVLDQKRKRIEDNLRFLANSTKILNESLDYQTTLKEIADLSVPILADYCFFDLLLPDGTLKRVAWKHAKPSMTKVVARLARYAPRMDKEANPVIAAIKTRQLVHMTPVSETKLKEFALTPEHLKLLRRTRAQELVTVPVIAHTELLGTLTFCLAQGSNRSYTDQDIELMQDLASRAAVAINNAQLYASAQKAIRIRDDFISVASHELKTPVTSLQLYTQSLERKMSTSTKKTFEKSYLEKMNRQIRRLTTLISDLLDVSRLQAGRLEFRMEAFDIGNVIADAIEELQPTTNKKIISANGHITKSVYGDKERIGQVVTNLISNAIKYSPKADKVIVHLTEADNQVVVTVEDFGIGIDKKQLMRIFERFYRASDTNKQTFPGLGIGLFICREIIRRHSGDITVTSEKGKGSRFSFSLPYSKG